MKKSFILLNIIFLNLFIFSDDKNFENLLNKMNANFDTPINYKNVDIVDQHDVKYDIGFKHITEDVELRISIIPADTLKDKNNLANEQKNKDAEIYLYAIACTKVLNISKDEKLKPNIRSFDDDAVKKEFGAEKDITTTFEGKSDFSGKYKYIMMTGLYKLDYGFTFIFFLFNNIDKLLKNRL